MSKISLNFNPELTIEENAKICGVSTIGIRKYMERNNISAHLNNYEKRIYAIQKAIKALEGKGDKTTIKGICDITGFSKSTVIKYLKTINENSINIDTNNVSYFRPNSKTAIKSISSSQDEILTNIIKLYIPSKVIDCDLTFSTGKFYKKIPQPLHKFDKYPQLDEVKPLSDVEQLADGIFDSIVVDLPFIVRTKSDAKSIINDRFTSFLSIDELYNENTKALSLAYRLLSNEGILIFKTQDSSWSGKQIFTHIFAINEAEKLGLMLQDIFILTSNRILVSVPVVAQKTSRKAHSYFLVFRKHNTEKTEANELINIEIPSIEQLNTILSDNKTLLDKMRMEVVDNIEKLYPKSVDEYNDLVKFGLYDAEKCAPFITKQKTPNYFLDNMALMPETMEYGDYKFIQLEILFQLARFEGIEAQNWLINNLFEDRRIDGWQKRTIKRKLKSYIRSDWNTTQVEWMKYCLCLKYQQSKTFRDTLYETKDLTPVEDGTKTDYSSNIFWGTKRIEIDGKDYYWGCNIVGKLLAELRDNNGVLKYTLPKDLIIFGKPIQDINTKK